MAAFDDLQTAEFAGYKFPWSRLRVSCSLRDHVHIYPHAPGGQRENLGRNLYEFHFTCPFHNTLLRWQGGDPARGSKVWPGTLASMRIIFEGGGTFDLTVPTIGKIQAYCTKWDEDADAKHRSGVGAEFSFKEDASELFLVTELIQVRAAQTKVARQNFQQAQQTAAITDSTFDKMVKAVNELEALKGAVDISAQAIAYKAESVVALCDRAAALPVLDLPANYLVLDSIRDMQAAAQSLMTETAKGQPPVVEWLVPGPFPMPVSLVSKRIYGDTSRSLDIMRLNALPDALAILPGTVLKVFAPSIAQAA